MQIKHIIFNLGVLLTVVLFSSSGNCAVVGSPHDMFASGKGTDPNVCSYCHVPHNGAGDKIWSTFTNESRLTTGPFPGIGNMCYSCHDGTVSFEALYVFNPGKQHHKITAGEDCDMCHTVHDNTNGMFMIIPASESAATAGDPTYCETCHDATPYPGAESLGDHIGGSQHPYSSGGGCYLCHSAHARVNYTTPELTHPILWGDNTDSNMCRLCHSGLVTEAFQPTTGGNKHPAILTTAGTWGKVLCSDCHDVHQPDNPGRTAVLIDDNVDSAFCISCHDETDTTNGPSIGHTHPNNVAFTMTPTDPTLAPAGNTIDDNAKNGPDYPNNSGNLIKINSDYGSVTFKKN